MSWNDDGEVCVVLVLAARKSPGIVGIESFVTPALYVDGEVDIGFTDSTTG
jgi:hypothetical protein